MDPRMLSKRWILVRKDRGPEGVEFEVMDASNKTLICSRITNRREADMICLAPNLLRVLKAVKPILEASKNEDAATILPIIDEIILRAS